MLRAIEAIAKADGSAGWNAIVSFDWTIALARFSRPAIKEVFARGSDLFIRSGGAPVGKAVRVEGGIRLSGQWAFASGSYTPDWIIATAILQEDGHTKIGGDGKPGMCTCLIPGDRVTFIDTWDVVGMVGSTSDDFVIDDVFVPDTHVIKQYIDLDALVTLEGKCCGCRFSF